MYICALYMVLIIIFNCIPTESNDYKALKGYADTSTCGIYDFVCDSGQCISRDKLCDSIIDCHDGSDETFTSCADNECDDYSFKCAYGACIEKSKRCNGEIDCKADQSDEAQSTCGILNNQPTCDPRDFRCGSGECIPNTNVCDGQPDCSDASDESSHCATSICESYEFRCTYGACIEKSQQCDGISDCYDGSDETTCRFKEKSTPVENMGCIVPTIANGVATLTGKTNNRFVTPGSQLVFYTCLQPYVLQPEFPYASCQANFTWSHVPVCNIACLKISPVSLDVKYSGDVKKNLVLPGTKATITCKQYYTPPPDYTGSYRAECLSNGQWNIHIFNCIPKCGQETTNVKTLILRGEHTTPQNVPWNIGIYRGLRTNKNTALHAPDHICGGTIISEIVILSAAHCFWNDTLKMVNRAFAYYVGAGKVFRDYNVQEDLRQVRRVDKIKVHADYRGKEKLYINDIAILILKPDEALIFGNGVQPACMDWNNQYEEDAFRKGSYGNVSGWGLTASGGKPSEVLKRISLPYLTNLECEKLVPPNFIKDLLHDKICVGGTDGSGVCEGDSGDGLMFKSKYNLWYIRGIVSISPIFADSCHPKSPAAFTKISFFKNWLDDIVTEYNNAFQS